MSSKIPILLFYLLIVKRLGACIIYLQKLSWPGMETWNYILKDDVAPVLRAEQLAMK